MTNSSIIAEIRNELQTNSTKVTDSYLVDGINLDEGELVMLALGAVTDHNFKVTDSYTTLFSTVGLVAGDIGFNGEYPFPSNLLRPLRVEISYDGVNWNPCSVYDIRTSPASSEHNEDQVNTAFGQGTPAVRFERDSYFLRPTKETAGNIAAGIHIWFEKRQSTYLLADIATDIPSLEPNFHRLYVVRGALRAMRKFRNDYGERDRLEMKREIRDLQAQYIKHLTERFKWPLVLSAANENFA